MSDSIELWVCDLFIYPVKSCAPVRVDALEFNDEGRLCGDRDWVVVDEQSGMVWQGSHPLLALVHPQLDGSVLSLRNPRGESVRLGAELGSESKSLRIWNDVSKQDEVFSGVDAGDEVADFLQRTVGARLRLLRLSQEAIARSVANPLHLVSQDSHEELAAELAANHGPQASLMRFRPNLVVTGKGESLMPFIEEQFKTLSWVSGSLEASLEVSDLCVRCVVPNVDPETGLMDQAVLATVSTLSAQRHPGKPSYFGIYARASGPARLTRGGILRASLAF